MREEVLGCLRGWGPEPWGVGSPGGEGHLSSGTKGGRGGGRARDQPHRCRTLPGAGSWTLPTGIY